MAPRPASRRARRGGAPRSSCSRGRGGRLSIRSCRGSCNPWPLPWIRAAILDRDAVQRLVNEPQFIDRGPRKHEGVTVREAHAAIEVVQNIGEREPALDDAIE